MFTYNQPIDFKINNGNTHVHTYCKSEHVELTYLLAVEKETRKANRRCLLKLITALLGKAKRREIDEDFLSNAQSILSL